jgi:hypothetical protein
MARMAGSRQLACPAGENFAGAELEALDRIARNPGNGEVEKREGFFARVAESPHPFGSASRDS